MACGDDEEGAQGRPSSVTTTDSADRRADPWNTASTLLPSGPNAKVAK
jgi:hypothetical protein